MYEEEYLSGLVIALSDIDAPRVTIVLRSKFLSLADTYKYILVQVVTDNPYSVYTLTWRFGRSQKQEKLHQRTVWKTV